MPRTTVPGYRNKNNQVVIRRTDKRGNDHNQFLYELECKSPTHPDGKMNRYLANGSDIWQRKCPECQGGRPSSEKSK